MKDLFFIDTTKEVEALIKNAILEDIKIEVLNKIKAEFLELINYFCQLIKNHYELTNEFYQGFITSKKPKEY